MKLLVIFVAFATTVCIAQAAVAKRIPVDSAPTSFKSEEATEHADAPSVGRETLTTIDEVSQPPEDAMTTTDHQAGTILKTADRGHYSHCPNKCFKYRKYCPHGCMKKHCTRKYNKMYRVKYPVWKKKRFTKTVPIKKYVCKRYGSHGHHHYGRKYHKKCFYKITYKHVTYYKNYKVYKYDYKYKFVYENGTRCERKTYHNHEHGKVYDQHHHGKTYHHNSHGKTNHHHDHDKSYHHHDHGYGY